ncbi:MAG: glycine cleavage system protein GcvH [Thermoleophilia bacterium]
MAGAESYPEDLRYHPEHDWARIEGDEAVLGITWWAQHALGEVVYVETLAVGGTTVKGAPYGEAESVKAVSDVIAPLSGEILEVNEKVVEEPESINDDPYGAGWLVRIRLSNPTEIGDLLDVEAYRVVVAEQ